MTRAGLAGILSGAILLITSGGSPGAERLDVVLHWNGIGQQTVAAVNPYFQSRSMAMAQISILTAITRAAAASGSPEAASITAAHDVLAALFPESAASLDAEQKAGLAAIADGAAKTSGIGAGQMAAAEMLEARRGDGWDAKIDYAPGNAPGIWIPTPPAYAPALLPHWRRVRLFAIASADQYRPGRPAALDSQRYRDDLREVLEVGAATSTVRPAEMTDAARFWTISAVQGWNPIARQASLAAGHTPADAAMTLAMLNAAIADALIACFDAKFTYHTWRPITAIRAGVADVGPASEWLPLLPTPPFPGYPSGHACAAGAAQAVLERRFGPDGHAFELTSATAPGVVFRYASFAAIVDQIDNARVYGGIHVREDQEVGRQLGRQVGEYVYDTMMRTD